MGTNLRSLLLFFGFWRLGKVADSVRWILSWTELFPCQADLHLDTGKNFTLLDVGYILHCQILNINYAAIY